MTQKLKVSFGKVEIIVEEGRYDVDQLFSLSSNGFKNYFS